jgi:hypothetical protein
MTQASSRTLIMLTAMLAFSFGGGMIGGYFGSMHVNREHAAETERLQVNVDRVSVATVNAIASLATDTEIVAADIVEISNRLDALEVKASDMSKSMSVRAGK